ncbi:MAG: HDIG domain-containing protein [Methanomassiliicoccales archaeon]|nr:HDIG domain-containing protein [Methanomassiliicoccales archaeon]
MSSAIPTDEQCIQILRDEGCKRSIIEHVCTVRSIAMEMARRSGADRELVSAGALLHDVGRSKTQGLFHVVEGVKIAKRRKLPDSLVDVIQHHVAAGFTLEEAKELGLPEGDYMPRTLEEKIVCHADNLVKGPEGIQTLEEASGEVLRKGHEVTVQRMRVMHRELSEACGVDIDELVEQVRSEPVKGPCAAYAGRRGTRP